MNILIKAFGLSLICLNLISCAQSASINDASELTKIATTFEKVLNENSIKSDYSKESLKEIETWLSSLKKKQQKEFILNVGAYLGECMIKNYGGTWVQMDNTWAVKFENNSKAFPLSKVSKFVYNGSEDSFYSMYTILKRYILDEE